LRVTVEVPANGIVRITGIPDDRPGNRMCLCHILEDHAAGMIAHLTVTQ
jgi:FtsP/CotA-like multicopper oxidase with cupredoxin domain